MQSELQKTNIDNEQALTAQLADKDQQIRALNTKISEYAQRESALLTQSARQDSQLQEITNSKIWKLGLKLRQLRIKMAPIGSRRDRLLRLTWSGVRLLRSQGPVGFFHRVRERMSGKVSNDARLSNKPMTSVESAQPSQSFPEITEELLIRAGYIRQSGLFDYEWYLADNPEVVARSLDPVEHYLLYGIQQEKNPNPLFNTSIYARWAGVRKIDALLHFKESGYLYAPGAYRSAEVLLTAQRRYREKLQMKCIKENRAEKRNYAIFLQCGSGSIHASWLRNSKRDWDLLVSHYDQTYVNKIPCESEFIQTGEYPGTKFTTFNQVLAQWPALLESYRYICLLDDDISMEEGDINLLFSIAEQEQLDLAQPSLSPDSHHAHPVFVNPGKKGMRFVNGVEIMMPVFSQSILKAGRHLFDQSISGWGIDAAISALVPAQHKAAVIDEIVAHHMKPINVEGGSFYEMLHRAYIYPEIELTHLQRMYGVSRSFYQVAAS